MYVCMYVCMHEDICTYHLSKCMCVCMYVCIYMLMCVQMGDANASIPTPQPVKMRKMFAGLPSTAASACSIAFVSKSCLSSGVGQGYALQKKLVAVKNVRNIGKKDMRLNDATPAVTVDPET